MAAKSSGRVIGFVNSNLNFLQTPVHRKCAVAFYSSTVDKQTKLWENYQRLKNRVEGNLILKSVCMICLLWTRNLADDVCALTVTQDMHA